MAKLRLAKSKLKPAGSRLKPVRFDDRSPGLVERKQFYASETWQAVRRELLKRGPFCVTCGDPADTVDHAFTHDDAKAAAFALTLGVAIPPHWRDRLTWTPGLQPFCGACHREKTNYERQDRLHDWAKRFPRAAFRLAMRAGAK